MLQKVGNLLHVDFKESNSNSELLVWVSINEVEDMADASGDNAAVEVAFSEVFNRAFAAKDGMRFP